MITIKSPSEIELMRKAGAIVRDTLELLSENVRPGISTARLDSIAYDYITKCGAKPSFLGYSGYPASVCISIDKEVVHGIPSSKRIVEEGQIVSLDVGAYINGYHGDAARSVGAGKLSPEKQKLIDVCRESFFEGIKYAVPGNRLGDVSSAIQRYVEERGYSVVRELTGHGIGKQMHEDPYVPNYGTKGKGLRLQAGMCLAVEPMINMGAQYIWQLDDGWTIITQDGMPSAHYENTIAITDNGPEILTL